MDPVNLGALAARLPVAVVGRSAPEVAVDSIHSAEAVGSAAAVDLLVSLGHERIAHVDGGRRPGSAERRRGYRTAMRRPGLDDDEPPGPEHPRARSAIRSPRRRRSRFRFAGCRHREDSPAPAGASPSVVLSAVSPLSDAGPCLALRQSTPDQDTRPPIADTTAGCGCRTGRARSPTGSTAVPWARREALRLMGVDGLRAARRHRCRPARRRPARGRSHWRAVPPPMAAIEPGPSPRLPVLDAAVPRPR
jgi:hypothetical protein